MKFVSKSLLFLIAVAVTALAQTPNTPIKHVIVVIQENRTPDNLFQDTNLVNAGGDIVSPQTGGYCHIAGEQGHHNHQVALKAIPLKSCDDPDHSHAGWMHGYNGGYMDGACNHPTGTGCAPVPYPCPFDSTKNCSQYTYVENTQSDPVVQPYWDIAEKYGFANYMFQTNQGPSFPAHQFLFSGSSVPVYPSDTHTHNNHFYYQNFVVNNPSDTNHNDQHPGENTGCIAPYSTQYVNWIDPSQLNWTPPFPFSYPCYDHATLTDLLDQNQLSWQWYPRALNTIWEAPTDIFHICQPGSNGPPYVNCGGTEWQNNFELNLPGKPPLNDNEAKALEDIENCNLPAVSWVIPDGSWSDHGGDNSDFKGPFWAAAIVNSVGNATNCEGGTGYWNDTVILITWDDWGGFYDHVLPWNCNSSGTCTGYPNSILNDNGSQNVYGLRVPLLVVSAYAKPGHISGACGQTLQPSCPNELFQYVHDFGSILNFIEYAFGTNGNYIGEVEPNYFYADHWAPDSYKAGLCNQTTCPYSLSDFFDFSTQHSFQQISLPNGYTQYTAEWFEDFNGTPTDPDDDAIDPQDY
jgi:phospholipase C